MSNNRLFIGNTKTKEYCLLAKGWGSGWNIVDNDELERFLYGQNNEGGLKDGKDSTNLILFTEYDPQYEDFYKNGLRT